MSIRRAIESLYTDTCDIYVSENYVKDNGATGQRDKLISEGIPCRVSYGSSPANNQTETAATMQQAVKLFIAPEINIPEGCRIRITRQNRVIEYKASGVPALYSTHKEINLDLSEVVTL